MKKMMKAIIVLCSLFLLSSCGFTKKKEIAQKNLEIKSLAKELKSKDDDYSQFNDKLKEMESEQASDKASDKVKIKKLEKENKNLKNSKLSSAFNELEVVESSGQYGKEIYQAITGKTDAEIESSKKYALSDYQGRRLEGTVGWHSTIGTQEETETHYIVYEVGSVKLATVYVLDKQQVINQVMIVEIDNAGNATLLNQEAIK